MSSLILLRHAQASFGAARYDQLSELGHEQAAAVGRHFVERGWRFSKVWLGPRERHHLTARYALEPLGLDWQVAAEPALDEFAEGQLILAAADRHQSRESHGEIASGRSESARRYAAEIDAWAENRVRIEGVPEVATFRATVADWLSRATASAESGQTVLAVTSAGVIAVVMCIVLDLPDAQVATFIRVVHNTSLTEFAFSKGRAPSLVSFNVSAFLPDAQLTRI